MITYRKPSISEVEEIAIVHLKTFKNFFLSTLGKSFLITYYKSCIQYKEAVSLCAVDENSTIVGFCFGSLSAIGFHKKLILNNMIPFALQSIRILFSKPKAIIRLSKNLKKATNPKDDGDYAELLSIGVLVEKKGLGIGKGLIIEFEKKCKIEKIKRISLTTDYNSNDAVLKFYKSMGYDNYYEFVTYPNRKMFKLIKEI
jgi:ribosomal protein S18 acetylase RimI-like enzyme